MKKNNSFLVRLIERMSLDQKVGALLTLGFCGTMIKPKTREAILKYHCGGLRVTPLGREFSSYIDPNTGATVVAIETTFDFKTELAPVVSRSGYQELMEEFQRLALSRPGSLPLHFSWDHEGGGDDNNNLLGIGQYPHQVGITATGDPRMAYEVALATAREGRAIGFNFIHSPVLDVNSMPNNPEIGARAFSDCAEVVCEFAEQSCLGFRDGRMIATGKHFPGRGASDVDAHYGIPVVAVDRKTMMERELLPYRHLIQKGLLPAVMIAHTIYPAFDKQEVATVSKKIVTDLLRGELGFEGVITTDSMTMAGISSRYGTAEACARAVEAGADLVLMKAENVLVDETFHAVKRRVESGAISETDLHDKVYRILAMKYAYGLFHRECFSGVSPEEVARREGIEGLRQQLGRRSTLLLRDRRNVLPLAKDSRVLVVEQVATCSNDIEAHPAMLFKFCLPHSPNLGYVEVGLAADASDQARVRKAIKGFDTVILTNYNARGIASNNEFVREIAADRSKRLVLITNTPYPVAIPDEADTVVLSFSVAPENVRVVADLLFGATVGQGFWPLGAPAPQ